ncbi:endo-1,4-beta-xylanase [Paenibacillus sp. FA6]|uniref:endo-1,4-beta-xylanase n=1 Tax=Paenibacillus sp. FA6 TaxID=3413029 RepID=UPI003F65DA70
MSNKFKKIISIVIAAALIIPSGIISLKAQVASPDIPVLLYHRVLPNPSNEWTDTSVDNFKKHMQYLVENGYNTLTAEQYVAIMDGTATAPEKPILLTFDDATPDFLTNTVPILNTHSMKAVQFVVSDWIGAGFSMSKADLQAVAALPNISLQNHTATHTEFVDPSATIKQKFWSNITKAEASVEIAEANTFIKTITGKDPILLAYPYGDYNADVQAAAAANGIKYSFKVGYPNARDHAMGRHYIQMSTTLSDIAGWIGGPAPVEEPGTPVEQDVVYHETFADSQGLAKKSGNATLTLVKDKVFAGNDDGAALYVSDRVNNWDAVDFLYSDIDLEDDKTYKATVSIFVDEDTTLPTGDVQAYLQTIGSYDLLANKDYVPGEALTLTKEFTVDTSKDTQLRVQSSGDGATVPFYIGDILITAKKEVPTEKVVYHETFADGQGAVATQSGSPTLESVTGKVFTGNADGAALYVNNRTQGHDAVDFNFSDTGLEDGKKYTVTVSVYVDEGVEVPMGAQAYLQTIGSYGLLANKDYVAGEALTLTKEFTVDASKDTKLRVQSNEDGKSVPFYIGDVLITEMVASGGQTPPVEDDRDPAKEFTTITFEDEETGGFEGRKGTETLTITNEENHTADGSYSLKVAGRQDTWHGPSLRVQEYVDKGSEYKISAWVKLIDPDSTSLQLSTQVGSTSASYNNLMKQTITTEDGWVQFVGTYRYTSVPEEYLTIYVESSNATASFYIDDISFVKTGSGPIAIEKDLTPIKDAYQDDFLIGNAVSSADMEGVRLELLKMHHNVVTAENAMKPDQMYSADKTFTPESADALVDKVLAAGLKLHGHVLVWHQQSPTWLNTTADGIPLERDEALANLRTHIKTVMEHYGDKVISWDVVNEAMNDNPSNPTNWKGALRQSPWATAIGSDYVEQSFLAAREVLDEKGWDIKLYYNDYNEDNQNKAQAIYSMVKEINDRYAAANEGKLLIDGVGMQAHYNINTNPDNVRLSLEKFISLGVEVSITELDIQAGSNSQLSEKLANGQGYLYAQLFDLYKEHAADIARVTLWGVNDATSWRAANNPLLFDKDLQAKPAYYGVINPVKFMTEHDVELVDAKQSTANFATPVIDGTIDAVWSGAAEIPINHFQTAWQGAHGTAKALWDNENLYVLIQVLDTQLDKTSTAAHEQDSVEIFLDQNNEKSSFYQADDGQYRINFDNETSFNPTSIADGFESRTIVSGTNYTVEVKIPLHHITPEKDMKLGFDVQINDAKDGARQGVASWNDTTGTGYMDTSVYGVLTLVGDGGDTGGNGDGGGTGGNGDGGETGGNVIIEAPKPLPGNVEHKDGIVTMKPEVRNEGGRVIATISDENLKKALKQSTPATNGKKQIVIELPKQANAKSYEVQLPTQSLKGQENFVLSFKTEYGTIQIPSNMLSNVTVNSKEISIRITKSSAEHFDADTREQIGNRPVLDLNVIDGDKIITWNNQKAPITISIPYTPSTEELRNLDSIVVWYIADNGKVTTITNSRYDAATGTVVFQTTHFSTYAVASVVKTFGDLNNVTWAKQSIDAMAARDVIKGTSANSFSPSDSINRADFIALLVRALELQGAGENETMFSDVKPTAYYYNELVIAKELGIALGSGDNSFNPHSKITRQDMMVLTARVLEASGKQVGSSVSLSNYPDADSISSYAKDSVASLVKSGVINGKNGNLAPNDTLTRAEAAVILYRIWNL